MFVSSAAKLSVSSSEILILANFAIFLMLVLSMNKYPLKTNGFRIVIEMRRKTIIEVTYPQEVRKGFNRHNIGIFLTKIVLLHQQIQIKLKKKRTNC
jgi:hypothetical protein